MIGQGHAAEIVPIVGCPADGQMGKMPPPMGEAQVMDIDPAAARGLALYQAFEFDGILAPRGWHCFYKYGSSGGELILAPDARIETLDDTTLDGPAIVWSYFFGDTYGRFTVARFSARLFQKEEQEFIQRVIDEGIETKEDFPTGPFPDDKLRYLNPREVEFETPAYRDGMGTVVLDKGSEPIYGLAALLGPAGEPDFAILAVRLPPELSYLRPAITQHLQAIIAHPQ